MPPEKPGQKSDAEREEVGNPRPLPFPSPEIFREFPDRAAPWLFEDPINVRELLQLVDPDLAKRLDFANANRINRTFIPADLSKIENDLLFRVPVFGIEQTVWVYLLLEHQSRVDPDMGLRLLEYIFKVWEAQTREGTGEASGGQSKRIAPVVPLVFYTGMEPWPQPISLVQAMNVPGGFDRFVPTWETLFLSLHGMTAAQLAAGPGPAQARSLADSGANLPA